MTAFFPYHHSLLFLLFQQVCAYGFLLDDGESIAGIRRGCRQLFTKHLRNLLFGTNIIRDAHAAIGPPPLPPLAFNEVNAKPSSPQQASTEQISIVDKQNVSRELSAQLSLVKEEEEDASTNGRADSSLRENNSSTKRNSMKMSSPFENGGMLAAPNGLQTSNLSSGSSRFVRNGSSMVDTTRTQKNIKHVPPLMRDPWGALDVCIVAISWLSFIPGLGNEATAFRALRLLLPLRMLSTLPGMKVGIQSILMSLPMLGNIVLAMAFILSVWTILGMQLFQSKFWCIKGVNSSLIMSKRSLLMTNFLFFEKLNRYATPKLFQSYWPQRPASTLRQRHFQHA